MNKPRLSIITINFNNKEGFYKTISSVVNQTYKNLEYIIIDGGSEDGSLDIIEQYKSKIEYWISEPDNGIFHAMNKGIRAAKGEYCQFLNSGDWLASDSVIERMMEYAYGCSILYGNMSKILPDGKISKNKSIPKDSFFPFYRGTLNHSPSFIKKCLFDKYGFFDENLKIVSDWKFFLIAVGLNNEPVKYIDLDVTCFNTKGISNINPELDKSERRQVLEELIPVNILKDYDRYWFWIEQMSRLKRFKLIMWLIDLLERGLFKLEKHRVIKARDIL